ncbi:MAG: 1-acyl-sn-glycerol-3-phosphate acyltransferase [Comamonas sp.]|jgi:1-acyl-sn-glycerol-3-phosphate acyltransferase|nr:1-acyl-sn-glycerol-3-phosphate acyltransferase [Comamonas sp.]
MAGTWRATRRLVRMLWHIVQGIRLVRNGFNHLDAHAQQREVEHWAQGFLRKAGIALQVEGLPIAANPVLWVANHQSWLDIPTLHAARYCRFVSKAEIAKWPLVGHLARSVGTLFIQRGSRRETQRIVQTMTEALQQGDSLAVFPEGTVGNGRDLLPFYGNTLQAAIDADVPIQPVGMTFVDARTGQASYAPCEAWQDEPIVRSLWRTLKTDHLVAVVRYGTPEKANGRDRRAWASDLRACVEALRQPATETVEPVAKLR